MFEQRKRRKAIEQAPDLIATTPDGAIARITGIVRVHDKTLLAPASGRICVVYALDVIDMAPTEGSWQAESRFETVDAIAFAIDNCIIDSVFVALVDIEAEPIEQLSELWDDYCLDRGLQAGAVREAIIEPGERVTVVGMVERRIVPAGLESGYRESGASVALVGDFDHPVLIARAG